MNIFKPYHPRKAAGSLSMPHTPSINRAPGAFSTAHATAKIYAGVSHSARLFPR